MANWTKRGFLAACALLAAAAFAATPRMSLRLRGPHTADEAQWRETFRALEANPGCCDEVWFSTGIGLPPLAWHRAQAARLARAAEDLRKIGVVPSLQFQATLGHSDAISALEDCSAKSWTGWTGSTGVEGRLCSCPRQPAFLAYVREMARLYAAFRPGSVWIDDDLRISNHAPATDKSRVGCWCATCLAAFNAETGGRWTREALDAAQAKDAALAARWKTFSVQAIAQVARAIAEEFHRLSPETTMGYQHCFDEGSVESVRAVARALAEASGRSIGLRPGGGFYYDVNPLDQVVKSFLAARFRARVPDLEGVVGTWCPEVESCPRAYGSRTAQSALVESFVALAYGHNSTSLLLLDTRYEKDDLYARTILKPLAEGAPALVGYAQANEGTEAVGFSAPGLSSARLVRWALSGIPVLPGAGRSLGELTAEDCALDVCQTGSADVQARRDALDARAGGTPAVLESPFMGLVVPRMTAAGALRTVALLNTRIEGQGPVALRLRGVPEGAQAVWRELRRKPVSLALVRDGACARVTVPAVGAWNGGFVDLVPPPAQTVCVEAERFADLGGWVNDAQFMDQMGSPFLLAHGMGTPVADATTEVAVPADGLYNVYARTRNWTAPWSPHAAGTFRILVNGEALPNELGTGSGEWRWQRAGAVRLAAGTARLALRDLTGFDGRCDAVCLTTGTNPERPCVKRAVQERAFDFVVCGGGVAGVCAAISAARLGLKVALVQDRPVLGGANSSEVRVHLGGYMNLGPYPRLGDVVAEIGPAKGGNARPAAVYEDARKLAVVAAEKNISLFLNTRVTGVEMTADGAAIASVTGVHVVDGTLTRFSAPLFADCTGDACVGALAGADFRTGRESRAETGEEMAPEQADRMTMGASVQWYTKETPAPVAFPARPWMIAFNEQNCEYATRGDWDWETGMMRDQIADFERIRDYGMLVAYSNWSYLKNASARKAAYATRALEWMAYVAGKRESRRLLGDHVLTQQDVFERRPYPDGTCCTTWAIDLHYPMPKNRRHYDGEPFRSICTHNKHYAYPIPYRCFYSRNVANLFMAGRNVSVTHVALGTVRVMRTTGMMGEVVGMAARVCQEKGCRPRDVYTRHLDALKALMEKGVGTGKPQPPQNYNLGAMLPEPLEP